MGKDEAEEEIRGFLTISTCLYSLTYSEGSMEMFKAGVWHGGTEKSLWKKLLAAGGDS